MRLNSAFFVMVDKPHHAPLLYRLPNLGVRLQRHLQPFWQRYVCYAGETVRASVSR
jgi:hypothetical protein